MGVLGLFSILEPFRVFLDFLVRRRSLSLDFRSASEKVEADPFLLLHKAVPFLPVKDGRNSTDLADPVLTLDVQTRSTARGFRYKHCRSWFQVGISWRSRRFLEAIGNVNWNRHQASMFTYKQAVQDLEVEV